MQSKISKIIILTLLAAVTGGASAQIKMDVYKDNIAGGDYELNYYFTGEGQSQQGQDQLKTASKDFIANTIKNIDFPKLNNTDLAMYDKGTFSEGSTFELIIPTTTGEYDCKMSTDQLNTANSTNETITFPHTPYCKAQS